jgi:hypothetical protein
VSTHCCHERSFARLAVCTFCRTHKLSNYFINSLPKPQAQGLILLRAPALRVCVIVLGVFGGPCTSQSVCLFNGPTDVSLLLQGLHQPPTFR